MGLYMRMIGYILHVLFMSLLALSSKMEITTKNGYPTISMSGSWNLIGLASFEAYCTYSLKYGNNL